MRLPSIEDTLRWTTTWAVASTVATETRQSNPTSLLSSPAASFLPPAIPLAVKSPYLNAWLPTGGDFARTLTGQWARHWPTRWGPYSRKEYRLPWSGMIRIDGKTYEFLGAPISSGSFHDDHDSTGIANQTAFELTATRSIFSFKAGNVEFNVTFLSPVTPNDEIATSLPFSYLAVGVDPAALEKHSISLYSDIGGEWASGDDTVEIIWDFIAHKGVGFHSIARKDQQVFGEYAEQAEWGNVIYAADSTHGIASSGSSRELRSRFIRKGHLDGTHDSRYRRIDADEPVFGFSVPLSPKNPRAAFTIGHVRYPYVNYVTPHGQVSLNGLWTTRYARQKDAIAFFQLDYPRALSASKRFDAQLRKDAQRVSGDHYASIVELSTRQAFASFELTTGVNDEFEVDESKSMAWLKEISSNGDMSTIDVIFPLHPILLYTNPTLLALLLEPLLVYTHSGLYPNRYPVHDLGTYPNATGYNGGNDEPMPVEEAGNMLWMALSYYQLTSDLPWVEKHYGVFKEWTAFLVDDGLLPANQLSTDDFAGQLANQTNLAVKAIVGIGAMAELANQTGRWTDWFHYRTVAKAYAEEWWKLAMTDLDGPNPHAKLAYQDEDSWGTLYNLFGDRILSLDLFPKELYDQQAKWYKQKREKYGVPLDSRHYWAKTDWQLFAAASTSHKPTQDMFIDDMIAYLKQSKVDAPFPDLYETPNGNWPGEEGIDWGVRFLARPVVGAHFSLLALEAADAANRQRRGKEEDVEAKDGGFVVQAGGDYRAGLKWEKEA
ncbi:uncharacterized protein JCM6883_003893 [Sporobolomyces salmoneus]|uniref:uncharacterized protein n=1 Tax=Sporobolomyces salmoneus TaxID=183962 RepID=UPI0031722D33